MTRLSRWWASISLLTKVTGVTVFLLTLSLGVAGAGTTALLHNYLTEQIDQRLKTAATDWATILGPGANPESDAQYHSGASEYYWASYRENGSFIRDNWTGRDQALKPNIEQFSLSDTQTMAGKVFTHPSAGRPTLWRAVAVQHESQDGSKYSLVIALSMSRTDDIMSNYGSIFFGFSLIIVVFGAILTRILVSGAFAPLRAVEKTASAIAAGDFSQRLRGTNNNTEVGRLNRSLNTMLNRIDLAFSDRDRTLGQMRRFVADASHELRTPLVTVRGYAELYRMGALQSQTDIQQAMERIEKEAIRMGGLVEDLLELARLDLTRPLQKKPLDLLPLARDAAIDAIARSQDRSITVIEPEIVAEAKIKVEPDTAETPIATRNPGQEPPTTAGAIPVIKTEVDPKTGETKRVQRSNSRSAAAKSKTNTATSPMSFAGETLARLIGRPKSPNSDSSPVPVLEVSHPKQSRQALIFGDENKIRQVITNLVTNALRFTPPASPIELKLEITETDQQVILSVIDHGQGVPPQIREKIFQRFWRADTSRTRETGGNGLGLAIVAAIVSAHQGRVWVEETEGGGATFVVTFPLHLAEEEQALEN